MSTRPQLQKILDFNIAMLDQALKVIEAHAAVPGSDYARHSGPHLRHVIEHYEAFTLHVANGSVDYDSRARDRAPERDAAVAKARILAIQQQLAVMDTRDVTAPVVVQLRGGLDGEDNFISFSSLARELLFLASHAVHHYAVIKMHCAAQGISLGEDFGKAPSTVRHARQN